MRRVLCLLSLTVASSLAAGCQPDFNAQYAETERKVKATEAKIDAEMEKEAKREPIENGNSD
ncbi:MAG: hypothetical protein K9G27_05165 [Sphingomonadaceae bacterium]|jgi:hypothetical protein|uniref:hypothetical protein n=1 Tax=Sphingorhabdus sp. TaxID=1902408 RepID=UPI002FD97D2F|nr:hypothetical protein [Sphingomonadaceae bacterium]